MDACKITIARANDKPAQIFNGRRFIKHKGERYYTNGPTKLHRYVWEFYNGKIPKGFHVHHEDEDMSNNHISNLKLFKKKKHLQHHGKERYRNNKKWFKKFHSAGIKAAAEYHKTKEGREKNKRIAIEYKTHLHFQIKEKRVCEQCGKDYTAVMPKQKFCSNNCKSQFRRLSGVDNIEFPCERCGKKFIKNRFSRIRFCSRVCAGRNTYSKRKKKGNQLRFNGREKP